MDFRIALPSDTEAVKALWAYCFEPASDPFFIYYFNHCYKPEHTMVGLEENQLLSTVHLRQYDLYIRGAQLPVSYMVGVATHPAARRGGVGGQLLLASLQQLKAWGQGLTILMPSKAAFYQQYGWELYAHQWVQTMPLEALRPLTDKNLHFGLVNAVDQWKLLAPVYEKYTKNLNGYALRGEKEWRRLLASFFAEGVNVALVRNDKGVVEGYCVYRLGAPEIPVTELVYTTRRGQKALLNYMYNHRSQGESIRWNEGYHDQGFRFHPDGKSGHTTMPYMMSRIVDVKLAMESVPTDHVESKAWSMAVEDSLASWNQGTYRISGAGQLLVDKLSDSIQERADLKIEIGALSLLLMGAVSASELAFEGKLQAEEDMLDYLDRLYSKQNTYINEWW